MTSVNFTFLLPDGTPIVGETFEVALRKAAFDSDGVPGIAYPDTIEGVTDSEGKCTLELLPLDKPYYLSMQLSTDDGDCCSGLRFRFLVPESDIPLAAKDLIITDPTWSMPWDEQALQVIIDAKASSAASAENALASENAAAASEAAAAVSATQAAGSALAAAQSAANANTSKNQAAASATAAAGSAEQAAASAQIAADKVEYGNLPVILGNNEYFGFEGESTQGWTPLNTTVSSDGQVMRVVKTLASGASGNVAAPFPALTPNQDVILVGRTRVKRSADCCAVFWINTGAKEMSIWFGSPAANGTFEAGAISICGTTGAANTRSVTKLPLNYQYETDYVTFALQFDAKYSVLNCFIKDESNGRWSLQARANCEWFDAPDTRMVFTSNSAANSWCDIDYLYVCKPNFVVWGDSIAEGKNWYSPNPALNLQDFSNHWSWAAGLYTSLRNNLPVVKGVGGRSTTEMLAALTEIENIGAKTVFFHASTNDQVKNVTQADRTAQTQTMIDRLNAKGMQVMLLNAMVGTQAYNVARPGQKEYVDLWWNTHRKTLRGVSQLLDINRVVSLDGFMDPALTEADGIHPNKSGQLAIGGRMRQFFGQGADNKPVRPVLTRLASMIMAANDMLIYNGYTLQTLASGLTGRALLASPDPVSGRSALGLWATLQPITANVDANTLREVGRDYYVQGSTVTNLPVAQTGWLKVLGVTDTNPACLQEYRPNDSTRRVWARTCNTAGVWDAWVRNDIGSLGNAASATIVTSSSDDVVGRLMYVGYKGLGTPNCPGTADLNVLLGGGITGISSGTLNSLLGYGSGSLLHTMQFSANEAFQFLSKRELTGRFAVRRMVSGSYGSWVEPLLPGDGGLLSTTQNFEAGPDTWIGNRFKGWSSVNGTEGPPAGSDSYGIDVGYSTNRRYKFAIDLYGRPWFTGGTAVGVLSNWKQGVLVGDFGLGSALTLAAGTDLNTLTTPGQYAYTSGALPGNTPYAAAQYVEVIGRSAYPWQIVRPIYGTGNVKWERSAKVANPTASAADWGPWLTVKLGDFGLGAPATLENTATAWQGGKFTGWAAAAPDSPFGTNSVGLDMGYAADRRMQIAISTGNAFFFRYANEPAGQQNWSQVLSTYNASALPLTTPLAPNSDAARGLGGASARWSVVYSATGAINTSDAREKTVVSALSENETAAAKQLSREIGTYKWLKMVEEKGDGARKHIGLTVQRAIEIMEQHGLEPFSYGFICYDEWEDEYEEHEATYETVTDEYGVESQKEVTPYQKVKIRDKGDRYSFRYDELSLFIAAGIEARLAILEQNM